MRQVFTVALLAVAAAPAAIAQNAPDAGFEAAARAWDRGHYPAALDGFIRVLGVPGGERFHERIALLTGELYQTTEVAPDGRNVRFSPDGRHAAYETGTGAGRLTHLVDVERGVRKVAELPGAGLVFSPKGERVAYVHARTSDVLVRDLESGRERRLDDGGLLKAQLAWAADGRSVYLVGARPAETTRSDIYALSETGAPVAVTGGEGFKANPQVAPDGTHLVYAILPRSPLPVPVGPLAQRSSVDPERVVIHDLKTGRSRAFPGAQPALSADGSAVVFLAREGEENVVRVARLAGGAGAVTVARTTDAVANPAISADGRTVVYQRMPEHDWELFTVRSDGTGSARLTREIQHDLFPRFLTGDRVVAVLGEGRHRRSHLYDVRTGERTRLFHNNTVRTIAPEYEWAPSVDGTKLLVVAERDGDTVSPERGVYLVDLTRKVTREELLGRLRGNLAAESDLRRRGERLYAPIAEEVRSAVDRVSRERLYEYQKALFDFGSKYITQPGNQKAIEYLYDTLKGWGYEPELQWFEPRTRDGRQARTANVVATLRGTANPELVYVVGSHFDSVERGPGADDNTSGTAMLLETARILKDRPLPATVVFVWFTGEEAGLLGSREFVRRARERGLRVVGALNNDMMGYANDHRLDNTIRHSNHGIRDLQHAAAFLFSDLVTYDAFYYKNTDAHAMYDAWGDVIGGIGSYPVLGNPHYHQATDLLETIDQDLMRETTRANLASVLRLASGPSRVTGLELARGGRTAEVRWTPAPERGVRSYLVAWGPESDPLRRTLTVAEPRAKLDGLEPGMVVSVKAVDEKGLESWAWARLVVSR